MEREAADAPGRSPRGEFRVGAFLVRPRLRRVVAPSGRVVHVQPKIMDVLVVLAERAGEAVTREELFEKVWAGTHVTEHVLARAISALRKIFGDRPSRPRFIETIPKTGYRLIAEVSPADEDAPRAGAEEARPTEAHAQASPASATATPAAETAATARADAASPRAFAAGLTRARFWLGLAALSCAAALVVFVLVVFLVTRDAGHLHLHPHH